MGSNFSLTNASTFAFAQESLKERGALTTAERAACMLLEGAESPALSRRALHVGQYAARIGRVLGRDVDTRALWTLGVLSVLQPTHVSQTFASLKDTLAAYTSYRTSNERDLRWNRNADILLIANTFEDAIERAALEGSSPADALRLMMRDRERYAPLIVAALRRALAHPSQTLWAPPRTLALPIAA